MRMSDWSSDVFSSDLAAKVEDAVGATEIHRIEDAGMDAAMLLRRHRAGDDVADAGGLGGGDRHDRRRDMRVAPTRHVAAGGLHGNQPLTREEAGGKLGLEPRHGVALARSEEHTSELQSLMRISY